MTRTVLQFVREVSAMRVAVCLWALAGLVMVVAIDIEEQDNVLVVTGDNYKQILDENELVLLEFCKYLHSTF